MLLAEANIQFLERRTTGREAEREVRKKIRDFLEGDRTDSASATNSTTGYSEKISALSLILVSAQHFLGDLRSDLTAR